MRRKVLIAAFCWLSLSETSAKVVQTANGVGLIDNISDESAPRLYRNVPVGVYAGATPYAAYSFHAPTLVAPKNGPVIPVKEESVMVQNSNGFLKDSYGQRFVEAPQTIAYKAIFPQQFVQLQNLPAHLSQPLVAASNLQYGQGTPHFFQQSQFRTPTLQTLAPSTLQQFTASQPFLYANNIRNFAPSTSPVQQHPTTQQQSTSNKNVEVYVNNLTAEHFSKLQNEPKFQRIQEGPKISTNNNNNNNKPNAQIKHLQLVQVPKETSITTVTNGKKTIVNLVSKPPVPLLDLTLLEPLTFKNPLVPQVQHFLPRINQVTYKKIPELNLDTYQKAPEINEVKKHQMEFIVQNTKTYDSGLVNAKSKNGSPKKRQKQPQNQENDEEVHPTPTLTIQDDSPEVSYKINSPNYKEIISEKEISYNKETESDPVNISYEKQTQQEPVHYTYEERTEKKPIHYSFSHSSKTPPKFKKVYSEINNDQPKQLIYHFNSEEESYRQPNQRDSASNQSDSDKSPEENSEEINREKALQKNEQNHGRQKYYNEAPKTSYHRPEQRERQQIYHHNENEESADIPNHPRQISYRPRHNEEHFQPIVPEYEEDIKILPSHKPHAPIKSEHHQNRHYTNKHNHNSEPQHEKHYYDYPKSHYTSSHDDRDKSERIVVKEGTTGESEKSNEELLDQMIKKQEESEEDFETAYKDAAYGFPAFDAPFVDVEKEIYNPESYGSSRYHNNYNIEKSPLRQYEADGDDYPKYTRSQYKDARDKTMDDYFLDYAVSRPESLSERHKKKEDYYKVYTQHKPEKYFGNENNKNQKAKHTATFLNGYYAKPHQKQQSSNYRIAPQFEEYNYNKEASRDNSAYSTQPQQHYKTKTQFVEPQYQYGFEPSSLPRLLDSELAAMASNHSPKSERPGIRKKGIKATWHIKKTNSKPGS